MGDESPDPDEAGGGGPEGGSRAPAPPAAPLAAADDDEDPWILDGPGPAKGVRPGVGRGLDLLGLPARPGGGARVDCDGGGGLDRVPGDTVGGGLDTAAGDTDGGGLDRVAGETGGGGLVVGGG